MRAQKNYGLILVGLSLIMFVENKKLAEMGWAPFWPLFILAGGLFFFVEYLESKEKGLLLPGIMLTGSSLILLPFSLRYLPWTKMPVFWPLFLLPLGLAYLLLYLIDPRERGPLIPAGLFIIVGMIPLLFQTSFLLRAKAIIPALVLIIVMAVMILTDHKDQFMGRRRSGRL